MGWNIKTKDDLYVTYKGMKRGQYRLTDSVNDAHVFKDEKGAIGFIARRHDLAGSVVIPVGEHTSSVCTCHYETETDQMESEVLQAYSEIVNATEKLHSLQDGISGRLSYVDRSVGDVLHAIEFKNYNVCDGYAMYKKLQSLLQERRHIKNEQTRLQIVGNSLQDLSILDNTQRRLDRVQQSVYTPKVMPELFDKE